MAADNEKKKNKRVMITKNFTLNTDSSQSDETPKVANLWKLWIPKNSDTIKVT